MPNKYSGTGQYFLVFNELVSAARHRGTVTYQELAQVLGFPTSGNYMATEIGQILDEINDAEDKLGHPILSALVIDSQGEVGRGFYGWCESHLKPTGSTDQEKRQFWESEKKKVHEHWRKKFVGV